MTMSTAAEVEAAAQQFNGYVRRLLLFFALLFIEYLCMCMFLFFGLCLIMLFGVSDFFFSHVL